MCGAIAQPIFGALSDHCTHPWGRRKPFMFCGAAFSILFLIAFASTQDLMNMVAKATERTSEEAFIHVLTQAVAVLWVCVLNIAMQPLQSGIRVFIIDNCPSYQQTEASAWSSRFSGLGSVCVLALGFTNVPGWTPFFGETEFKRVSVFATIILTPCLCIRCLLIREKRLVSEAASRRTRDTFKFFLRGIWRDMETLPPVTRRCVQSNILHGLDGFPTSTTLQRK